jgi:hypothetical protein
MTRAHSEKNLPTSAVRLLEKQMHENLQFAKAPFGSG